VARSGIMFQFLQCLQVLAVKEDEYWWITVFLLVHAINNSITYIYVAFSIICVQLLFSALWMMNGEYHICYCGWKVHTLTNKVILNENNVVWFHKRHFMFGNKCRTNWKKRSFCRPVQNCTYVFVEYKFLPFTWQWFYICTITQCSLFMWFINPCVCAFP
jgi:hypothetical protein